MAVKSKIEWTDSTWTPIRARNKATGKVGWHCEHVSPGCVNCYAENINRRLGTGLPFKPGHRNNDVDLLLDHEMLLQPLRWRLPRMVFVCSMTDLFADFVPDEWIDKVFTVMALGQQHVFQVLTKRSSRMRDYMRELKESGRWLLWRRPDDGAEIFCPFSATFDSVFRHIWLGVSCEDQQRADERIPHLLETPAAVRFVSAEPLLSPIVFRHIDPPGSDNVVFPRLDLVIVGGESGPGARPFYTDWGLSIVQQCRAAGVACFIKQLGAHVIQGFERRKKRDKKGADMSEWPHELRVREMPARFQGEAA